MALPNLKDYYQAAQLGTIIKWCDEDYSAKWKDIERTVADIPVQSLIGNSKLVKASQESIDPISSHTLNIWFDAIEQFKLEREVKMLSWFAYDDCFKPSLSDQQFINWTRKGITAVCTIIKNGNIISFIDMKEKFGLEKCDFFQILTVEGLF